VTEASGEASGRNDAAFRPGGGELTAALAGLEKAILDACAAATEWPAQIAAGVYAGVDFAISHPVVARTLTIDAVDGGGIEPHERVIARLAGLIQARAPRDSRQPGSTDEALVGGVVGLVGDHVRVGRFDRLAELRPELVLLTLLPYLGFSEAQRWANQADSERAMKS
jgi:hypothetical protein